MTTQVPQGLHIRLMPYGEVPYNGEQRLELPVYSGELIVGKHYRTMEIVSALITACEKEKRKFPITTKELELNGIGKFLLKRAEKDGLLKNIVCRPMHSNSPMASCYIPTEKGRAFIEKLIPKEGEEDHGCGQKEDLGRSGEDSIGIQQQV